MVQVIAADPATGAIAFAKREGVTHAVFGHDMTPAPAMSPGSIIQRFSTGVRGVNVRVVSTGPHRVAIT